MTKPQVCSNIKMKMFKIWNYIKKNKLFVFITLGCLLLPMVIELFINCVESKITYGLKPFFLKISYTFKEYKSYYATILTLSFAIFSNNKQQEKLLEEKQKENELKEKELEDKKDYYRPMFIVKKNADNPNKKSIILLMKDDSLYLENIKYHVLEENEYKTYPIPSLKSKDTIKEDVADSFYITAQTLLGETILFYFMYDNIKVYKYLKSDNSPMFPLVETNKKISESQIDKIWGSFNSLSNSFNLRVNENLSTFFSESFPIRLSIVTDENAFFDGLFKINTLEKFYKSVFDILNEHIKIHNNTEKVSNLLLKLISASEKHSKQRALIFLEDEILNILSSDEFNNLELINKLQVLIQNNKENIDDSVERKKSDLSALLNCLKETIDFLNEFLDTPSSNTKDQTSVLLNNFNKLNLFEKFPENSEIKYLHTCLTSMQNNIQSINKDYIFSYIDTLTTYEKKYSKELTFLDKYNPIIIQNSFKYIKEYLENTHIDFNIILNFLNKLFDIIIFDKDIESNPTLNECKIYLLIYLGYIKENV